MRKLDPKAKVEAWPAFAKELIALGSPEQSGIEVGVDTPTLGNRLLINVLLGRQWT
jgi:hypothetical protein